MFTVFIVAVVFPSLILIFITVPGLYRLINGRTKSVVDIEATASSSDLKINSAFCHSTASSCSDGCFCKIIGRPTRLLSRQHTLVSRSEKPTSRLLARVKAMPFHWISASGAPAIIPRQKDFHYAPRTTSPLAATSNFAVDEQAITYINTNETLVLSAIEVYGEQALTNSYLDEALTLPSVEVLNESAWWMKLAAHETSSILVRSPYNVVSADHPTVDTTPLMPPFAIVPLAKPTKALGDKTEVFVNGKDTNAVQVALSKRDNVARKHRTPRPVAVYTKRALGDMTEVFVYGKDTNAVHVSPRMRDNVARKHRAPRPLAVSANINSQAWPN